MVENTENTEKHDDCLFCKIVAGEIPSTKEYEDDSVYAFDDINPKAKVHVLIVPKHHFDNVVDLERHEPKTLLHMIEVAQKITDEKADGTFRLIFNTGKNAGQSVLHAHAHVLTGEVLPE